MAPISKPVCAICISALARRICRCSSPRSRSSRLPSLRGQVQGKTGTTDLACTLSGVIRQRFKMRRKIRALASEGRASAMILSSLPILMFLVIQIITPDFYASVWHEDVTKIALACAGCWMGIGNLIMFRMVNFKI